MYFMASGSLEKKVIHYAQKLRNKKRFPSAVSGAEFRRFKNVDHSKPVDPTFLVNKLRNKLLQIGELYTRVNGNILGCCAEVNSANSLLLKRSFINLNDIQFSRTIRPRTLQVIKECRNCKQTF